jgi:hypothetical protein
MAQAIALVIDSFFRELAQTPAHEEPEPSPKKSEATPTPSREPSMVATPAESKKPIAKELPKQPEAHRWQAAVTLGGSYESTPSKAALLVGFSIAQPWQWRTQLQASLPFSEQSERHEGGVAVGYVMPVRWSVSYVRHAFNRFDWSIGPEALLSIEQGAAKEVSQGRSGWRVSPGIGAQTGLTYWATQSVALGANLAADEVLFQSRSFSMYDLPALQFSKTRLSATLGITGVIWP